MKKYILILIPFLISFAVFSQRVGIGTNNPGARLHVTDSSVVFSASGDFNFANIGRPPIEGEGRRMLWYPDKASFRVGYTSGTTWDKDSIGIYSFASGLNAKAKGYASAALGIATTANGDNSIALGIATTASGASSTAMGSNTTASGISSTSMGFNTRANGARSTAMGYETIASGDFSTAIGYSSTASGAYSTVIGSYVSTSGYEGCLTIGDRSTTTLMNSFVANGFRSRFAGGYRLFTNSTANIGSFLNAGANAWAALSDERLKEQFLPVDGELFLLKIADMPLTTWNYIGQDEKTFRHYGPMAQHFYQAFGKDEIGSIGCDTLINQQDFLGVNLIAIQALEKRTRNFESHQSDLSHLKQENALLKEAYFKLLTAFEKLSTQVDKLQYDK